MGSTRSPDTTVEAGGRELRVTSGDRVIFVDDNQLIEVHGGSGEPGFISRVDPRTGRRMEAQCPALSLELQTGRLNAPECPSIIVGQ